MMKMKRRCPVKFLDYHSTRPSPRQIYQYERDFCTYTGLNCQYNFHI